MEFSDQKKEKRKQKTPNGINVQLIEINKEKSIIVSRIDKRSIYITNIENTINKIKYNHEEINTFIKNDIHQKLAEDPMEHINNKNKFDRSINPKKNMHISQMKQNSMVQLLITFNLIKRYIFTFIMMKYN